MRGFDRFSRRSLRPTPERLEIEDLLANFRHLELSTESELLILVTPERAQHNQFTSPAFLLFDSPFIPGAFIHSTLQQTPFFFQYHLPTSVPLSPLTPLSTSKSSPLSSPLLNPTPSPSLSFVFDFSTRLSEPYLDQLSLLCTFSFLSSSLSSSVLSPPFRLTRSYLIILPLTLNRIHHQWPNQFRCLSMVPPMHLNLTARRHQNSLDTSRMSKILLTQ